MTDTKEVVLFFNEGSSFNPLDIAKEIINRIPDVGDPIIMPTNNSNNNLPIVMFSTNVDIKIQINRISVNILVTDKYFESLTSFTFDLIDLFEDNKCSFNRLGYITSLFMSPKEAEILEKRYINIDAIGNPTEYNLSFYHELSLGNEKINAWEKVIKDPDHIKDLLCQFDINNKKNQDLKLDMKYLKKYFKLADEYIQEKVSFK